MGGLNPQTPPLATPLPWQPACTPRVQERWASGVDRESALTDRGRTCEYWWRGEPLHSGRVVKCPLRTGRVGIVGGGVEPPSSCLQTLIFEWKSALNFNLWAKFQTIRQMRWPPVLSGQFQHCVLGCSVEHCVAVVHSRRDESMLHAWGTWTVCIAGLAMASARHWHWEILTWTEAPSRECKYNTDVLCTIENEFWPWTQKQIYHDPLLLSASL